MGLKKRSKVSAEFSMSSLTDIIFLLLIFFMLTSSLVAPNSLNLKLPGSSNAPQSTDSSLDQVRITRNGNYYLNGRRVSLGILESELAQQSRGASGRYKFTIAFAQGTPTEYVVAIMDIALTVGADGILAAEKR